MRQKFTIIEVILVTIRQVSALLNWLACRRVYDGVLICGIILWAQVAHASRTIRFPIGSMIARADAVAIVRIDELVPVGHGASPSPFWRPTHIATVSVTESLRGPLPKTFKVEVDGERNPSVLTGAIAVVLTGDPFDRGKPAEGYQKVFEGASGFCVLNDLVSAGDTRSGSKAAEAIKESVAAYRPGATGILNDEAATPFIKLWNDDNPAIRRWAVDAIGYMPSPFISAANIEALRHNDKQISHAAAQYIIITQSLPGSASIKSYADGLPPEEAVFQQAIYKYLAGRRVATHLNRMPAALSARLLPQIKGRTSLGNPLSEIMVMDEKGEWNLLNKPRESLLDPESWDQLISHLRKLDPKPVEWLPLRVTVNLWVQNEMLHSGVREWPYD